MSESAKTYEALGVSASKEGVHAAVKHLSKGLFPNAFCKVLAIKKDPLRCVVPHSDTAGTKASLAYMYAKETGDLSVLRALPINSIEMNLGDMACVGAVGDDPIVLINTIGRNKRKISDVFLKELIEGSEEYLEFLRSLDIDVNSGGGETADVGDIVRTLDVGHAATVTMPITNVVSIAVQEGDVVVGLSSAGQATYERAYNSGLGGNGYTLARHGVLHPDYRTRFPETYDPELLADLAYGGSLHLEDRYPGLPENVGKSLLSPTRTYLPILRKVLANREGIHGIIHCTGGGQTKINGFLPEDIAVVKNSLAPPPPVFRMIQEQAKVSWEEMYQVFNCGNLMELYVTPDRVDDIIAAAASFNVEAQQIGICRKSSDAGVYVESDFGKFWYPKRKSF